MQVVLLSKLWDAAVQMDMERRSGLGQTRPWKGRPPDWWAPAHSSYYSATLQVTWKGQKMKPEVSLAKVWATVKENFSDLYTFIPVMVMMISYAYSVLDRIYSSVMWQIALNGLSLQKYNVEKKSSIKKDHLGLIIKGKA